MRVLAIMAGLAGLVVVLSPGAAADTDRGICPNTLCVFADEGFGGQQVDITRRGLTNKLANQMDDQASSLVNDRGGASFIYAKKGGKGRTICLESGNSLNYLSGLEFDDVASSTRLTNRDSCFDR